MISTEHLYFHNVADTPCASGLGGQRLARFPESLWPCAEAPGRHGTIRSSNACEIQFVADGRFRLYLRTLDDSARLVHFTGNHWYKEEAIEGGELVCINVDPP